MGGPEVPLEGVGLTAACRSCGGRLDVFLDLGRMPLANALPLPEERELPEARFPLEVALCADCALVQLTETVPPEVLFSEYLYFSSFSTTMVDHAHELAHRIVRERKLGGGELVCEIASNDGYLLQWYAKAGIPVLGIEPARNVAKVAVERGIATECAFFGRETATRLVGQGRRADVVHAHNVLAHVADLSGFVAGLQLLLKPTGVAIVEVPYLKDLLDRLEFDTIYHEHLFYFSVTALVPLLARHRSRPPPRGAHRAPRRVAPALRRARGRARTGSGRRRPARGGARMARHGTPDVPEPSPVESMVFGKHC